MLQETEEMTVVCARCEVEVEFENVTTGYFAVCPNHDEDLDEWETAIVPKSQARNCNCGRDDLESGILGEPAEHDDGCPIWERAKREMIEQEKCVECGNALDKFSLDGGYKQCEPCSIVDVNKYFESVESE